jgi:DNA-binding HxlR family transcriptional regulator
MMMKRPSLFALLSILERIQSSVNRRCSFDEIARSNPKLRNRTATSKYLKLMQALGLVKFESFEQPVRNPWRWRRGRTLKRYFLTEKGRALLRLFAPLGTESDTTD